MPRGREEEEDETSATTYCGGFVVSYGYSEVQRSRCRVGLAVSYLSRNAHFFLAGKQIASLCTYQAFLHYLAVCRFISSPFAFLWCPEYFLIGSSGWIIFFYWLWLFTTDKQAGTYPERKQWRKVYSRPSRMLGMHYVGEADLVLF